MAQAELGQCQLAVTGSIGQQRVSLIYHVTEKKFVALGTDLESRTLAQLTAGLRGPRAVLNFLALPPRE